MEKIFKALADPTRRKVLELLKDGPKSAGALAAEFAVSKPTMSAHFAVLREADLIHAERRGKQILYHLKLSVLEDALLGCAEAFDILAQRKPGPENSKRSAARAAEPS